MTDQVIVIGGGLLGSWAALNLQLAGHGVTVLEQGGAEPSRILTKEWSSRNEYFGSPHSGIYPGLGGRSNWWGGVFFDNTNGGISLREIDPSISVDAYTRGFQSAALMLAPKAIRPDLTDTAKSSWGVPFLSLLRSAGPLNGRILLDLAEGVRVRTNSRVDSLNKIGDEWVANTNDGSQYRASMMVLASGTIECTRLAASSGLLDGKSSNTDQWFSGLGDHAVVGLALNTDSLQAEALCGLDAYLPTSDGFSYTLAQIRRRGASHLVDVWALVEVGGAADQGIRTAYRGSSLEAHVDYQPSTSDRQRVVSAFSNCVDIAMRLSDVEGLPLPRNIADGEIDGAHHFNDTDFPAGRWRAYQCRPGTVQHEYGGLSRHSEALRREGLLVLGGARVHRIGPYNPTASYMAVTSALLEEAGN